MWNHHGTNQNCPPYLQVHHLIKVVSFSRTNPQNPMSLVRWLPFSEATPYVLEITSKLKLVTTQLYHHMRFWTDFLPSLFNNLAPYTAHELTTGVTRAPASSYSTQKTKTSKNNTTRNNTVLHTQGSTVSTGKNSTTSSLPGITTSPPTTNGMKVKVYYVIR